MIEQSPEVSEPRTCTGKSCSFRPTNFGFGSGFSCFGGWMMQSGSYLEFSSGTAALESAFALLELSFDAAPEAGA